MKYLFTVLFLSLGFLSVVAQVDNIPKGIYNNTTDFLNRKVGENYKVKISKRTKGQTKMTGGNDYRLQPVKKSVRRKVLREEVMYYSNNDSLFINCFRLNLGIGYAFVESLSDGYIVFKGGYPPVPKKVGVKASEIKGFQFPNMFGLVGALATSSKVFRRYPYLYDLEKKKLQFITNDRLEKLLESTPLLLEEYIIEKGEKSTTDLIVKYLKAWNEKE